MVLITAQRLARRLCLICRQPANIPRETLLEAGFTAADLEGNWKPYKPVGCASCSQGYKGRVGIYQVMPISEEIEKIILAHGTALQIEEQARIDGVDSLREAGLVKVKHGLTSLEEVLGCTNE